MEITMRTSPSSYVVCDVTIRGYDSGESRQVMLVVKPRMEEHEAITFDLSIGDSLDLIAGITREIRKVSQTYSFSL